MLATFMLYILLLFLYAIKNHLFSVFEEIVVFQLSHNTTHQDKLGRFCSSVRRRIDAGEVREDMSTMTH